MTFTPGSVSNAARTLKAAWNTLTRSKSEKGRKDFCIFVRGIACRNTGKATERRCNVVDERAKVELEGGGWFWFYVCGECHGFIKTGQETCPYCERRLIWNESEKNVDCRAML